MKRNQRWLVCVVGLCGVASGGFSAERFKPTGTIKDLEQREVEVRPDPPRDVRPQQAIEQYRHFLELQSADPRLKAEAMRRLGDLQLQADEAARAAAEGEIDGLQVAEAVALYEGLLAAHPDYERADAVLYQLSRAREAQGATQQALLVLNRLVTQYPHSTWTTEAQFRRGEILFSAQQYALAERAYTAVIAAGEQSSFFEQSLYKHGWSLFKQARGEESVGSFLQLLDRVLVRAGALQPVEALGRAQRELIEDALRVIAITFSDLDGPISLDAFLARQGDPIYAHRLYEALGQLYLEKERYQDAAQAYEAFAKRRPEDRFAPSLQMHSIEAYQQGGFASLVLDGKQAFVERYAFGGPFWASRAVSDAPEVAAQLKANQRDLAEYWHAQAQQTRAAEHYAAAIRWYRAMLDSFPEDLDAPQTRYLLADALFESERFAEAAKEYERTAYDYPLHPAASSAGYAALIAYERHEVTITGESRALWHRQGIESALMFATSFPEHEQSARVMTKAGEQLFALNEFDRTIDVARGILERQPPVEHGYQRTAATLLAHSLFDRSRFAEAEQAYVRVQSYLLAGDADRPAIEERIAASIYKQAEEKRDAGDAAGAVADFLRVSTLAPNSKVTATAQFDAAALLIQSTQWERAAAVLEDFRRKYPQHELQPEVTRSLALAYLESGRAGESAGEFERIAARTSETAEVRRAALWQAAELYEQAQQPANAIRAYSAYVQQFPLPLDPAMDARQKLADAAQATNDVSGRSRWLQDIIEADRRAGAARTDRSRYLAARATLETVEPQRALFAATKLVIPLNRSLQAKRQAMERALSIYEQALEYGVAEVTTAATFGMAELYRGLAADLMASERPQDLDAEVLEQYDVLLEEQAFPFEEQAIELHEANARRAADGIYDEWVQQSFAVLSKLKPARYAKTEVGEDYAHALH